MLKDTSKNRSDGMVEEWNSGKFPNIPLFHFIWQRSY